MLVTTLNALKEVKFRKSLWAKLLKSRLERAHSIPFPLSDVLVDIGLGGVLESLTRVMGEPGKRLVAMFSCDCAERVLPVFESAYPGDARPRRALESARAILSTQTARDEIVYNAAAFGAVSNISSRAASEAAAEALAAYSSTLAVSYASATTLDAAAYSSTLAASYVSSTSLCAAAHAATSAQSAFDVAKNYTVPNYRIDHGCAASYAVYAATTYASYVVYAAATYAPDAIEEAHAAAAAAKRAENKWQIDHLKLLLDGGV